MLRSYNRIESRFALFFFSLIVDVRQRNDYLQTNSFSEFLPAILLMLSSTCLNTVTIILTNVAVFPASKGHRRLLMLFLLLCQCQMSKNLKK